MRLSVKVLGGVECSLDAKEDYTVDQLKADIEAKLKLGKTEQKLLFKGKTLQGSKNGLFGHYFCILIFLFLIRRYILVGVPINRWGKAELNP